MRMEEVSTLLEVFFADSDESSRCALRWMIPWEQQGFTCTGDASDGEMALSLLRRQPPDLLVTAIHMPYMNGLELCGRIRQEFPDTKLMVVSSSSAFEHLQRAIEIGVDAYLLKDTPPDQLLRTVQRLRRELEENRRSKTELQELRKISESFNSYKKAIFFEELVTGSTSVSELYDHAHSLGLDLKADTYTFLLCSTRLTHPDRSAQIQLDLVRKNMEQLFLHSPQFECFPARVSCLAILIKADAGRMDSQISFCLRNIRRTMLPLGDQAEWTAATAHPVSRVSALGQCFDQACEVLAYSYLVPGQQHLTPEVLESLQRSNLESELNDVPIPIPLSEELDLYLRTGTPEESRDFARRCVDGFGSKAIESPALCRYLILRIRFAASSYVDRILHLEQDSLLTAVSNMPPIDRIYGREPTLRYLTALLSRATELRDSSRWSRYHPSIRQGLRFIDQHFTDPDLSLNRAAEAAGLSPNYFSTLFRREVCSTFGEYLTDRRMCRARELLRTTALRSSQVAKAVGYQDAHYFSSLFRKTQGCTPREYRARSEASAIRRPASGEKHP